MIITLLMRMISIDPYSMKRSAEFKRNRPPTRPGTHTVKLVNTHSFRLNCNPRMLSAMGNDGLPLSTDGEGSGREASKVITVENEAELLGSNVFIYAMYSRFDENIFVS